MIRLTAALGGVAGLNVVLSFLYQWYVLVQLGPGRQTDALFAGMMLPQVVLAVVAGSLSHVLVPLLATEDGDTFRRDAWTFLQSIGLFFGGCALLLGVLAPIWVPLTVPGFDSASTALTIHLVRIQLIGMVLTGATGVAWAAYHARQRFLWAEVSPLLAGVICFPLLVVGLPRIGVAAAAWVLVIKVALQMLLLLPGLGRYHLPSWRTPAVHEAWRRLRPLLLGTTYYKTDVIVDRFLASMAPAGGLSLLHLSGQLYGAGHQVLNTAIAAPMVPRLARQAHDQDWSGFRQVGRQRLMLVLAITGAAVVAALLVGRPMLTLIFGHGRFGAEEITQLWWLVLAMAGVGIGGAAGQILSLSFYARGDTTTPTRVGVAGFTLGIFLKIGGFYLLGVVGIALGATLYYLLNALLLHGFLGRQLPSTNQIKLQEEAVVYEST